jgi:hypothetical protein
MSRFSERRWAIIPNSKIGDVNFDEVLERDTNNCIINVSGSLRVVKWDGSTSVPSSVAAIDGWVSSSQDIEYFSSASIDVTATGISGSFKHSEILELLAGREWTDPATEQ